MVDGIIGVNFGAYDPLSGQHNDSAGKLNVSCSNDSFESTEIIHFRIELNAGLYESGSTRAMSQGSDLLSYNLFQDSARQIVWGIQAQGQDGLIYLESALAASQSFDIYGRLFGAQLVAAGTYNDTITVTVTY
jgi:spore coat protein U-like protein